MSPDCAMSAASHSGDIDGWHTKKQCALPVRGEGNIIFHHHPNRFNVRFLCLHGLDGAHWLPQGA